MRQEDVSGAQSGGLDRESLTDRKVGEMAVAKKKKPTAKQQKEEERQERILQLSAKKDELSAELAVLSEKRDALKYPSFVGQKVSHVQYGEGVVQDQQDTVLVIEYDGVSRKQKLPFVVVSGLLTVENTSDVQVCQEIDGLDQKKRELSRKIEFMSNEISDLEAQA